MKTQTRSILIIALSVGMILLALWIVLSSQNKQRKQYERAQQQITLLEQEKQILLSVVDSLKDTNVELRVQKIYLEEEIEQLKKQRQQLIISYEQRLKDIAKIPSDTIYEILYAYYPVLETIETKLYPFGSSQIRGMYFTILDRDKAYGELSLVDKALSTCEEINTTNSFIIENLTKQTTNLSSINKKSTEQIQILGSMLDVKEQEATKQKKRKTFYKYTAVGFATLVVLLVK